MAFTPSPGAPADSLTCQQCHQPLILDPSVQNLTQAQYTLIASSLPSSSSSSTLRPSDKLAQLPPTARPAAEIWAKQNPSSSSSVAESFIMLDESVSRPSHTSITQPDKSAGPSSHRHGLTSTDLAQNLHRLISSKTPISHPICVECITLLQVELQAELDELQKERDAYIAFEQGILRNRELVQGGKRRDADRDRGGKGKGKAPEREAKRVDDGLGEFDMEGTQEEWDMLIGRKKELADEEERLIEELKKREGELEGVREEEEAVRLEEERVDKEEQDFLLNHHALSSQLRHLRQTLSSAETHLLLSTSLLQHLESTNVYNDAFQIGYVPLPSRTDTPSLSSVSAGSSSGSGYVGTINGLRLGGRPVVDWEEINAAWGLVALCVDRVAARVGFTFAKYKIHPLGSNSIITELPPSKQSYELHASPDLSAFLHNRRFSTGLICLLDCIRQLVDFGQKGERGWPVGSLEIRKDRISGYSIRLPGLGMSMGLSMMGLGGSSSDDTGSGGREAKIRGAELSPDEHWTKACLAVLKVLKQILIAESEAEKGDVAASAPVISAGAQAPS